MSSHIPSRTVDAESLSPSDLVPAMLELFDSLLPGERFVFASTEPPDWLLAVLRSGRHGQFDWTPLCDGGETHRIEISRRSADRGSLRGISEALDWEHARLARLEVGAFVARAAGDTSTAASQYETFFSGLRRHIAVEEDLLFPLFEERASFLPGSRATDVMRTEHAEILRLLEEIRRTIGDPAKLPDKARAAFHEILEEHHRKEEHMLYPALDEILTREEADALVSRIQGVPC